MLLGTTFLGIKATEYTTEYKEHLVPGPSLQHRARSRSRAGSTPLVIKQTELFFVFYFFMTGLHAFHMVIGIGLMIWMAILARRGAVHTRVPHAAGADRALLALRRPGLGVPLPAPLPDRSPPQMSELIHASHSSEPAHEHILPVKTYLKVYVALMVLLVATVGAAFIDMGPFNFALTMVIAVAKAAMILLIFMHVRYSERLVWVFSSSGVPLAGDLDRAVAERLLHPRLAEHPGQVVTPINGFAEGWVSESGFGFEPLPQRLAPAQREQRACGQGRQGVLVVQPPEHQVVSQGDRPARVGASRRTSGRPAWIVPSPRTRRYQPPRPERWTRAVRSFSSNGGRVSSMADVAARLAPAPHPRQRRRRCTPTTRPGLRP